jgi:VWFA-related protein
MLFMQLAVVLLSLLGTLQAAQQPPPPQTYRSGAQVVEVDVRVTKDGHFLAGLGLSDFQISEDGVPQQIVSVILVNDADAPSLPAAARGAPPAARLPRTWVFLFDTPHLTAAGLQRAREATERFIAERFRDGDLGGVVVEGRMVDNRLTSNRGDLKRAVASARAPGGMRSRQLSQREWPRIRDELEAFRIARNDRDAIQAAVSRACSDDPDQCRMAPPDVQVRSKARQMVSEHRLAARQTLTVVDAVARGLARIPGPKAVVFFSEGFVIEDQEGLLRQAVGQAARAGARIYAVDARGLNTGAGAQIIDAPFADTPMGAPASFDAHADGANSLAIDTGGFVIRNENDFNRALDEIRRDAATYYVVAYAPANDAFDGRYREIAASVARDGVKVRARRGYLALEPAALLHPQPAVAAPARPATTAAVPAERAGEGTPAKADLPVSASPTDPTPVSPPDSTIRTRVDAGRMALALGKDAAAPPGAAQRGWEAYEKGDVETAAKHLGEAAAAPDARPWVVYVLGLSQFALGRHRDAARSWERVRGAAPGFEPIYFGLADAYTRQEDEGAALRVLRDAEARWPADPEVSNAIGVIQVRRGALDAAIESFARATSIAPSDALGYFNLGRALQMRLLKSQRYDRQMEKWVGGDEDRRRAVAAFTKYVELGGPYEQQAREALASLAWRQGASLID